MDSRTQVKLDKYQLYSTYSDTLDKIQNEAARIVTGGLGCCPF